MFSISRATEKDYPVIVSIGKVSVGGLHLFENINDRVTLKLVKTKSFHSGAIVLYYEPAR